MYFTNGAQVHETKCSDGHFVTNPSDGYKLSFAYVNGEFTAGSLSQTDLDPPVTTGKQLTFAPYDNMCSYYQKGVFAKEKGLAGIMFWTFGTGTFRAGSPEIRAIVKGFMEPEGADPIDPQSCCKPWCPDPDNPGENCNTLGKPPPPPTPPPPTKCSSSECPNGAVDCSVNPGANNPCVCIGIASYNDGQCRAATATQGPCGYQGPSGSGLKPCTGGGASTTPAPPTPAPPTPAATPSPTPPPCQVTSWSGWGSCSTTCGPGSQTRSRSVTHSGDGCPHPLSITQPCNFAVRCNETDCDWSTGPCSATCGPGVSIVYAGLRSDCTVVEPHPPRTVECWVADCPAEPVSRSKTNETGLVAGIAGAVVLLSAYVLYVNHRSASAVPTRVSSEEHQTLVWDRKLLLSAVDLRF